MNCPNCGSAVSALEIIDDFGQNFEIKNCANCGGFWFDQNVLYRVPIETGIKIDPDLPQSFIPGDLKCPRDGQALNESSDVNLPPRMAFHRCPYCHGVFLFKGQLHIYKEYQQQKLSQNLELSKKAVRIASIIVVFFFLAFVSAIYSENIIKADALKYDIYQPALNNLQTSAIMIFLIFLLLLIIGMVFRNSLFKKIIFKK